MRSYQDRLGYVAVTTLKLQWLEITEVDFLTRAHVEGPLKPRPRAQTAPAAWEQLRALWYHVSNQTFQMEFTHVTFAQISLARINHMTPLGHNGVRKWNPYHCWAGGELEIYSE